MDAIVESLKEKRRSSGYKPVVSKGDAEAEVKRTLADKKGGGGRRKVINFKVSH
jgi:hypothetical protein